MIHREKEIKKIAIVGAESTGKSSLAFALAKKFHTEWVPEYAREYLNKLKRPYNKEDLLIIAKGQIATEDRISKSANKFLFCDTNLIVIKVWSDHKYGSTDPHILSELSKRSYDYYLLMNIDLPWKPDPLREHPNLRLYFFDIYRQYLQSGNHSFSIISGISGNRFESAVAEICRCFP